MSGGRPSRRVLLKLSGEALSGGGGFGVDPAALERTAKEVAEARAGGDGDGDGATIAVVVGGGNFFRGAGAEAHGMDRLSADYMGMLATLMNALALRQALEKENVPSRVMSGLTVTPVAESYVHGRALKHLRRGRVVVFACGTGNPLFTTDTAAALRAIEIGADLMLKATKVDGVYESDPAAAPGARRYDALSYDEALARNLGVMDAAALALCRDHRMPIRVFDMKRAGCLRRIMDGADEGTLVGATQTATRG